MVVANQNADACSDRFNIYLNMPKKHDSICSQCRRAAKKLMLKGDKCLGPKCPMVKRNYPPGQHGPTARRAKVSGFGKQLKEKQQAKEMYGLRERQFSNYVSEAARRTGNTSDYLVQYLESRLDNVVFRMGLAASRRLARQIVNHGHMVVNGKKVDIPSFRVKVGDIVAVNELAKKKKLFENVSEKLSKAEAPSWLAVDATKASTKMLNIPKVDNLPFNARVIIEFYSR